MRPTEASMVVQVQGGVAPPSMSPPLLKSSTEVLLVKRRLVGLQGWSGILENACETRPSRTTPAAVELEDFSTWAFASPEVPQPTVFQAVGYH